MEAVQLRHGRAHHAPLDRAGAPGLDQLSAQSTEERLRHGGDPQRPQPAQPPRRLAEQRVAGEALQERRVVVVQRQHKAKPLDGGRAWCTKDHRAVGSLRRADHLKPVLDGEQRRDRAVAYDARRVTREARGQS